MKTSWENRYAHRTRGMQSSAIREILKVTQQPDVISFAGGLPAPEAFPLEQIADAAVRVIEKNGAQALQYSTTEGYPPLRRFIVEKMKRAGVNLDEDNVLITTGSQQALSLVGMVLLDRDDVIVCEAPSYLGALQVFGAYEARFATVSADDDGMQVEHVEAILKKRKIKFIYALPNFQNPGGTTMSLARREKLVKLSKRYNVALVEDDPYGELRFEGEYLPPLMTLSHQLNAKGQSIGDVDSSNLIYLCTFSKTLTPGLRLGWIVAPHEVILKLVQAKQCSDLHTSTFDQMLAYEVVKEEPFFAQHVQRIRDMYCERRSVMLAAMEKYFPPGVHWTRPQGGLFLWVVVPEGIDTTTLLPKAVEKKVAFVPGGPFFAKDILHPERRSARQLPRGHNTMRLNFSNASPAQIEEGIRQLGGVIEQAIAELEHTTPKTRKRK